jgi:hypothetical protein
VFAATVTLAAGARETLAVALEVEGGAPAAGGSPASWPSDGAQERPSRLPPTAALVVAGVGLGAGLAGGIVYFSGKSSYDAACPQRTCASTGDAERANDARTSMVVGDVLMAVGGAGLAAGVVLWAVFPRKAAPSDGMALTVGPRPDGAALRWKAAF